MVITYKWLDKEQLTALDPIMQQRNLPSLNQEVSRVLAAYDGDKLIGFLVLQLMPHMEPLWVDPKYRGGGTDSIANILVNKMFEFVAECNIRGFFCVADSNVVEKMCIERGLIQVTSPVFIKLPQ